MSIDRFVALITGACNQLGIASPILDDHPEGAVALSVDIRDLEITMAFEPRRDRSRIFLFCRLGPVPAERAVEILQRLLQANYARIAGDAALVSMDPATADVILEYNFDMQSMSAEGLIGALEAAGETASVWRETHFLDDAQLVQGAMPSADFA